MLPMAAFVACDSDGGGNLDLDELKTLFWLVEGKEPEHSRISKELEAIDTDKGGSIDRVEWISYLISPDPIRGGSYFDFKLRDKFLKFDTNHDGNIDKEEFIAFLKEENEYLMPTVIPAKDVYKINEVFD